ncbi:MAG: cell wall hydrolase [Clostridia bacterium]|nr:cell wall hydrolase [Clostridia bacterium]
MNHTRTKRLSRLGAFLAALMLAVASLIPAVSAAESYDFPAGSVPVRVTLDGKEILTEEAVLINSVTYVPLRSFSELAGADSITWNAKTGTATVKKGSTSVSIVDGGYYLSASGRYFYTDAPVRNISNRLFVPIRPIAKTLGVEVDWDNSSRTVVLRSTGKTLPTASAYYDSDDLYWLSRIISAEASGESLYGQIAVGNVVLNRVASRQFPNTVYGVIFDRVGGTQFSPVAMGTIYRTPSASSVIAAKICLEGYSISDQILFFMNPRIATSNWISKNRPFAFSIGNHDFYK